MWERSCTLCRGRSWRTVGLSVESPGSATLAAPHEFPRRRGHGLAGGQAARDGGRDRAARRRRTPTPRTPRAAARSGRCSGRSSPSRALEVHVRPSERFADHLVFRTRAAAAQQGRRRARRPPRHGLPARHLRGLPPRRRPRARAGRARHEGRPRRHRVRAEGARRDGRPRRGRAGARRHRERRGGRLARRAGGHRRGHRRVGARARLRGRAQGRRDHHAPQGHRRHDGGRARQGGARRATPTRKARTPSGRSRASSTARRSSPTTTAA